MDITSTFWKCLSTYQHERVDLLPPVKPKFPKPITQLKDPYLIQASQISQSIKEIYTFGSEIQKQYLGIDPSHTYTTSEKEAIDIKCALMIAQCRASIQSLELALLGSENTGFLRKQTRHVHLHTHYTSIVQQLQQKLLQVSNAHQRLQAKRMDYELNDVLSVKPPSTPSIHPKPTILPTSPRVLASSTTSPSSSTFLTNPNPVLPTTTSTLPSSPLEKKQQLQLEAENQFFLEQWCAPLEEVQQTESSLLVISQIQAELAQHLANHQVTLEHVWEEAEIQTEHMNEGNKHLSQVLETGRGRRLWFLILVLILSFLLLFLDWYHDRFFKSTYLK